MTPTLQSEPRVSEGMLCPTCKIDLMMSDRQGIEIDYCPKCRGIWLDRGELDKIIERNQSEDAQDKQRDFNESKRYARSRDHDDHGSSYEGHHGRGRRSFLERLFD